jgi:hypothetical protein
MLIKNANNLLDRVFETGNPRQKKGHQLVNFGELELMAWQKLQRGKSTPEAGKPFETAFFFYRISLKKARICLRKNYDKTRGGDFIEHNQT